MPMRYISLRRLAILAGMLILGVSLGISAPRRKVKLIIVRYNLLNDGEELSVVKNDPVRAGQINRVVLTMFNSGAKDYRDVTITPFSKDRYINVRMADRTLGGIPVDKFNAGALKTLRDHPVIITIAPTCPDEYKGTVYLTLESEGYVKTVRQFVVEVSNAGILSDSPERFNELYGGLGVKPPPSVKMIEEELERAPEQPTYGGSRVVNKNQKGRSSESINATIRKYQMEVYYCYQQQLRKWPDLQGSVIIKFSIKPFGDVIDIRIIRSTLENETVEDCLIRRIKTWKFPTIPRAYGNLEVTYPFVFNNK